MPTETSHTVSPMMWHTAYSWIATNLVEQACHRYTASELETALIEALNPSPEVLAQKGRSGCSIFVNHVAHILKIVTQKKLHLRTLKSRHEPYNLTEAGRTFFEKYYADRHGR